MRKKRVHIRESVKRKYRIKDRHLSSTGELSWPIYLAIQRLVCLEKKSFQTLTEEVLLKRYAPVAVLVDHAGNLLYIHGQTGLYLEPAQGYAGVNNVLRMAKRKLRRDINITLRKAVTKQALVESSELPVKKNGETIWVKLTVIPLLKKALIDQEEDLYVIVFNQKNKYVEPQTVMTLQKEAEQETQIIQEIDQLHLSLASKEIELAQINSELENVKADLEISRNKLHSVKENIYLSETELQTVTKKIAASKDHLQVLNKELIEAKNELEDTLLIPEKMTEELTPISQELEIIKNELSLANQELNTKKEELEKLNPHFDMHTDEIPSLGQDVISEIEISPLDQGSVSDAENSDQNFDSEPFSIDLDTATINDKGMGFFSKNEPKSFYIPPKSLAFGHGSEPIASTENNNVLTFKDVMEFQTAADHGFRHDNEIKSVIIPEGVEVIKRSMFYKCTQLETVSFPSTLKIVEDFAFYGCEKLTTIALETCRFLETIGTSAFEGCIAVSELVIPDSVIEIEEASFLGCKGLEMIKFQDDSQLEILGSHAFKDCPRLTEIILPDQLKHIGISCFYGCQSLSKIHLPRELQTVGEYAFWGCNALSEIKIANKKILKQPGFSVGFPEGIKL